MDWVFRGSNNEYQEMFLGEESSDDSSNESLERASTSSMIDTLEYGEQFDMVNKENAPNPYQYLSHIYFSFNRESYNLMIRVLQDNISISLEMLRACDDRGMLDLKKWRRFKDSLCVEKNEDGSSCLCLCEEPKLRIACIEDWGDIVHNAHHIEGSKEHRGANATLEIIKSIWCVDIHWHGIPLSYIKAYVQSCGCSGKEKLQDKPLMHQNIDLNKVAPYVSNTVRDNVNIHLENIMVEYKTRLVMVRSSKNHGPSKTKVDYICHRGGTVKRNGSMKRLRTSKKCGCPFKVQIEFIDGSDDVSIYLYPNHEGHVPGSRSDLYHLPIHLSTIECCTPDLFDVGSSCHVAQMSILKKDII